MEYIRKTVDSNTLYGIFDIPSALRNKKVEVIILPANKEGEDPFYSEENQARLARSIVDAEAGRITVRGLLEVD